MDEDLPDGWVVWSEDDAQLVLAYRPDVFEGQTFPAACLPTIRVRQRPPDRQRRRAGEAHDGWWVSLGLEPGVRLRAADRRAESREAAVAAAVETARAFAAGDLDYRGAYQRPREAYLDELDERTG
jgi:hypothetical protein